MQLTINFTIKEILPSLLDKSKTQTIRKAWEDIIVDRSFRPGRKSTTEIHAKFKIGDRVDLKWNEDSKHSWFQRKDGTPVGKLIPYRDVFKKNLGVVEITEVFKLKAGFMTIEDGTKQGYIDAQEGGFDNKKIARLDGFKTTHDLMKYLENNYDLSEQKEFWVYRWKWIK